jgi:hypothetical protein
MVFGVEGHNEEEPMPTSQRPLHDLSKKECLELLQYHSFVGRLGFVLDGRPMVLPVNYLADEDAVVFCTAEGTALRRGPLHSWVTRAPERWVRITIEEVTGRRLGQR